MYYLRTVYQKKSNNNVIIKKKPVILEYYFINYIKWNLSTWNLHGTNF